MVRSIRICVAVVLLVAACDAAPRSATPAAASRPRPAQGLALHVVARGLEQPLYATAPTGDSRLFIVEQPGRIRVLRDGRLLPTPFLDLTRDVRYGGERGLLGAAFHRDYARNGFFYVDYTDRRGDTRVERFTVSSDPDRADPSTRRLILAEHQPYPNHNGGQVLFGPDGMLYVGLGDGGGAGDPHGNGQNRGTLLGALLRLDVDHGDPYAIPPDNPFAKRPGFRGEIWAWGLRNPWRFCFDAAAGRVYIADVGQNRWEEVDVASAAAPGLNYGWNRMEGAHCFPGPPCDTAGLTLPILEYGHSDGCSVTGGFVYRGRAIPSLAGHYFFGDYCAGWIRSLRWDGTRIADYRQWEVGDAGAILSFGTDGAGELYVCSANGTVSRLTPAARGGGPAGGTVPGDRRRRRGPDPRAAGSGTPRIGRMALSSCDLILRSASPCGNFVKR